MGPQSWTWVVGSEVPPDWSHLVNKNYSTPPKPWEYKAEVLKAPPHFREDPIARGRSQTEVFLLSSVGALGSRVPGRWCGGALSSESSAEAAEMADEAKVCSLPAQPCAWCSRRNLFWRIMRLPHFLLHKGGDPGCTPFPFLALALSDWWLEMMAIHKLFFFLFYDLVIAVTYFQ